MEKTTMTVVCSSEETPSDLKGKWSAVAMCWIFGLGAILSWNVISTLGDYFYEVFPEYHPERVLTIVYAPLSIALVTFFLSKKTRGDTSKRHLIGYVLFSASNIGLLVLDLATSGKGGMGKYVGICLLVLVFSVADAHVQGGMVGNLAFMCPEFVQSYLAGMGASGALTSVLRLITKAAFKNVENGLRKGALVFLVISIVIELLCVFFYAFVFPDLPVVKYYRAKAAGESSETVASNLSFSGAENGFDQHAHNEAKYIKRVSKKQLFFENYDYAIDLFLIYVVTLSIFPGFLYENTGSHQLGTWYPLVLVTTYNVSNLAVRYVPLIKALRLESRKGTTVLVLSRFVFIPLFYFTSKYGDQGWMIVLVFFLGATTGYPTICIMTVAPQSYTGLERNALGDVLVLSIQIGCLIGVSLDWLWIIGNGSFLLRG